ncbi:MAG: hypothetical protein IIZ88_07685 [Prevotella sp.]|nr:hypothetical protein [Prevotella sp.]
MRKFLLSITLAAMTLLSACSNEDKAHSLVKDFLNDNLSVDFSIDSYQRFDSTKMVTPAAVQKMRESVTEIKMYENKPTFADYTEGQQLLYLRVKFTLDDDTTKYVQTFYLDNQLQGVVAVKEN